MPPPIGVKLGILAELDMAVGPTSGNGYYCEFIPAAIGSTLSTGADGGNGSYNGQFPSSSDNAGSVYKATVSTITDHYPGGNTAYTQKWMAARWPSGSVSSTQDGGAMYKPGVSGTGPGGISNTPNNLYKPIALTLPYSITTGYRRTCNGLSLGGISGSSNKGWAWSTKDGLSSRTLYGGVGVRSGFTTATGTAGSVGSTDNALGVYDHIEDANTGSVAGTLHPNAAPGVDENNSGGATNIIDNQKNWRYCTTWYGSYWEPQIHGFTNNPYTKKKWQREDFYGNFQVGVYAGASIVLDETANQSFHMTPRQDTDSCYISATATRDTSSMTLGDASIWTKLQPTYHNSHSMYSASNAGGPGLPCEDGASAPSTWMFSGSGDNMPSDNTYEAATEENGRIVDNFGYDIGLKGRPRLNGIPLDAEIQYVAIYNEISAVNGGYKSRSKMWRFGEIAAYVLFTSDSGIAGPNE